MITLKPVSGWATSWFMYGVARFLTKTKLDDILRMPNAASYCYVASISAQIRLGGRGPWHLPMITRVLRELSK